MKEHSKAHTANMFSNDVSRKSKATAENEWDDARHPTCL